MGVIVGVHDGTANGGTEAHVTGTACFTELDVDGVDIAYLTDGCLAAEGDEADFAAGKTYLSVLILLSKELSGITCAAYELCALAGEQLNAVNHGADGDVAEGQSIADLDIGALAGNNGLADLEAEGSDDVALFAVSILYKSDIPCLSLK